MMNTYRAVLKGNHLEWRGDSPPEITTGHAVDVEVTVSPGPRHGGGSTTDAGERMAAALEQLAASDAVTEIVDPVTWQREMRRDRRLPGRD